MRKIFLTTLLAFSASSVSATTLDEALTSGYDYDDQFKSIRVSFLEEIEAFPRALSEFMPRVFANFDSTDSKIRRKSGVSTRAVDAISSDNSRYTKSLTLEQPLFNGWSSVSGLKAAQSAFRASRGNYYAKEQDNFLDEINIYLSAVESKEKYAISKVSVRSNKKQLEAMREKFKLGESTETEVASAREGLATAEAGQALAYANYESSKANFERVFGVPAVDIKIPALPGNMPISLDVLIEKSLAVNPSINSAMHNTISQKATENASKGALLPRVTFRVQNGRTYYNPQEDTNSNLNSRSTTSTLSVTVPILQKGGAEYSDIRRAKYATRKSAINHDSVIKKVKANAKASWSKFDAAKLRIKAAGEAVKAAEIAYEGMIQEEMLGSKTIVDVLRTEERLNKARETVVEAKKLLVVSAYEIKSLIGELTAKSMKLKVDYFSPESEFKKVKLKIVGF
jgi:outer membrane protein